MALNCAINYITPTLDGCSHGGGWGGGTGAVDRYSRVALTNPPPASPPSEQYEGFSLNSSGNWNNGRSGLSADTSYYFRVAVADESDPGIAESAVTSFKTNANAATAQTPTSSAITATTATIACDYTPNVNVSTCSAQLQYKKTTDSTWTDAGSPQTTGGSAQINISRNITGLEGLTSYQVRLVITRTTNNDTSLTSATHSFTTLASTPTVTTNAASSVTHQSANLNATVDPNTISCDTTFQWDTNSGVPYANETTPATTLTGDGNQAVQHAISSLSASTTYYFRAKTTYNGGVDVVYGSELSFTTSASPDSLAAQEDHMHIYNYDGTYGAATDIYFTLSAPAGTSSDRLVTTAPGSLFAAGDIKISKDGAAFANVANSVTQVVAANPTYKLQLSASEMQAELALVQIVDQDGPAFRDQIWVVRTKQRLGQVMVDASNLSNVSAVTYTGQGTGHGFSCVGGATGQDINGVLGEMSVRYKTAQTGSSNTIRLDASASATNDFYNGNIVLIVSGTGAAQVRTISDYDGTSKDATVHKTWSTVPDATSVFLLLPGEDIWEQGPGVELSAVPSAASSWGKLLQFVFQRFAYKRTQTATLHTMLKADSSTTYATASVSDNGSLQSFDKVA